MTVVLTHKAEEDLVHLYEWIAATESVERADRLLNELQECCQGLSTFPDRGRKVPELMGMGIVSILEIFHKSWRIIYEELGGTVYVYAVINSRWDVNNFLEGRFLR